MKPPLTAAEAKIVLGSLVREEERLLTAIAFAEEDDEIADLHEELLQVQPLLKRLRAEAVEAFGPSILT